MIPTLFQNNFPSVGSAPIDVGKGGQERSLPPRMPVSPLSAHSGSQTASPTTTGTPITVFPKRKFTGTIPVMDHFGTGPTTSPSVSHLPSRAPITDAPISSYPSASPSTKSTPKPTVSPSIPVQSYSQSEAPRLFSTKPSKGSINTPNTLSLSLTAKPLSGLMYPPSTKPTLYPSSLKDPNQSEPLSLQTFEQNSNKAGPTTTAAMSKTSGGTISIIIISVVATLIALIIVYVRVTRRKKHLGTHAQDCQDQQHLTLQASRTEIQGYVQRIDVNMSESNGQDDFDEDESRKTPGSPSDGSVLSRTWDREVNHHFAQHFSPRSLVDQPSSSTVRLEGYILVIHSEFMKKLPNPHLSFTLLEYVKS
jgi:hypothetical protein